MENTTKLAGPVELFSSAWFFVEKHWKTFVPIVIIPYAFMYGGGILVASREPVAVIVGALCSLVGAVLAIVMYPGFIDTIHRTAADPSVQLTVRGQYAVGARYFWSFILLVIIAILVDVGSFMLAAVPGIIVGIYGSVYLYTLVVDGKRGFSALTSLSLINL